MHLYIEPRRQEKGLLIVVEHNTFEPHMKREGR
ncbi:hypothetical protein RHBI111906_09540 [Rhodothermus bifroesti]|nr:hypothetical protein HRbin18_01812 [bacterium HR18]